MENKLIGLIITLFVGVVLVGSLVVPIVSAFADSERTYTNDGALYSEYDGESHTILVSRDSDGTISIETDGEECISPDFSLYGGATLVYGSDGILRLVKSSSSDSMQILTSSGAFISLSANESVTITLTDSGATMVKGSTTKTGSFTPLAYISSDGEYSLCENPRVTNESTIILGGLTAQQGSDNIVFCASGTIDNLSIATPYVTSSDSLTVSSVSAVANTSVVDGDLVCIDSIVFTATMSDDSEWTGTYTYFLAPASITYDNPDYIGTASAAVLGAVVVVLLVALIVFASRSIERD